MQSKLRPPTTYEMSTIFNKTYSNQSYCRSLYIKQLFTHDCTCTDDYFCCQYFWQ